MTSRRLPEDPLITACKAQQAVTLVERAKRFQQDAKNQGEFNYIYFIKDFYPKNQTKLLLDALGEYISSLEDSAAPPDRILVAYALQHGLGVKKDPLKAMKSYQEIAEQKGDYAATARALLGIVHKERLDTKKATEELKRAANDNSALAMTVLGFSNFFEGRMAEAKEWLSQAANLNDPSALAVLSGFLEKETRESKDEPLRNKIKEDLMKSAELGCLDAFANLGMMPEIGGVLRPVYLRFAAGAGHTTALYNLGCLYKNQEEAFETKAIQEEKAAVCFRHAFQNGSKPAFLEFSRLIQQYEKNKKWFPSEADKRHEFVMTFHKAMMYGGQGTIRFLGDKNQTLLGELVREEPWELVQPLLDEKTAEAVINRGKATDFQTIISTSIPLPTVLVELILAYTPETGDPTIKKFQQNYERPLTERAKDFLAGKTSEIFYLMEDPLLYPFDRVQQEHVALGKWMSTLAEEKNDEYWILQGLSYQWGWGKGKDTAKAEEYYQKAGCSLGKALLGSVQWHDVNKREEAIANLTAAAELDDPVAQFQLYYRLEATDASRAIYIHCAAEAGHPLALYFQGFRFLHSHFEDPDQVNLLRAKTSFIAAAELGLLQAVHQLGQCYAFGIRCLPQFNNYKYPNIPTSDLDFYALQFAPCQERGREYLTLAAQYNSKYFYGLGHLYQYNFDVGNPHEKIKQDWGQAAFCYRHAKADHALRDLTLKLQKRDYSPKIPEHFAVLYHDSIIDKDREELSFLAKENPSEFRSLLKEETPEAYKEILNMLEQKAKQRIGIASIKILSTLFVDEKDDDVSQEKTKLNKKGSAGPSSP